ncbi:MAG TPA: hypothetical protein VGR57_18480 [Ktedonobacterales bacterium]|nr:hypothetical protein [Ktedonobacterales bacterium]
MLRLLGHLLVTVFEVCWRIVFIALFGGLVGAGAVLLVTALHANDTPRWPPSPFPLILLAGLGMLAAYATAVTVLMVEAVRALQTAAHAVAAEAAAPRETAFDVVLAQRERALDDGD